jgi:hypothetical protein
VRGGVVCRSALPPQPHRTPLKKNRNTEREAYSNKGEEKERSEHARVFSVSSLFFFLVRHENEKHKKKRNVTHADTARDGGGELQKTHAGQAHTHGEAELEEGAERLG